MRYRQAAFALGLLILTAGAAADSALAQRRDECSRYPMLFENDRFRGESFILDNSVSDLHDRGFGDSASSVCVPFGWRVILYEDTNFRGDTLQLTGPETISDLRRDRPGGRDWGDRVSSAQVYPPRRRGGGNPPQQCDRIPMLFGDDDYQGRPVTLRESIPDLHKLGVGDQASSLCVPRGWRITIYEDSNYRGDRLDVTGPDSIADLRRDRPGGRDWGDRISSVRVEPSRRGRRDPDDRPQNEYPDYGRDSCGRYPMLFEDEDLRGRSYRLDDSVRDLYSDRFGREASSLCVPRGWRVTFYENRDFRGRSFEIVGPQTIEELRRTRWGNWDNQITSARIEGFLSSRPSPTYDPRPAQNCGNNPVLYSDDDFRGRSLDLTTSVSNLHRQGMGDSASSICVPRGWEVTLYEDTNYRGDSLTVTGPDAIANLGRQRRNGSNWGDDASSVRVRRRR